MKKVYITPSFATKALDIESLMANPASAVMLNSNAADYKMFAPGDVYSLSVDNNPTGPITQDAKGGLSDWEDL